MSERLLIDTDIAVDYLRGAPKAIEFLESVESPLVISAVTVAELFAGVREGHERTALNTFLTAFEFAPVTEDVAQRGGLLRRDFGRSYGTRLADALIAATAEISNARLVTLNQKHFPMFGNVLVPYQKLS